MLPTSMGSESDRPRQMPQPAMDWTNATAAMDCDQAATIRTDHLPPLNEGKQLIRATGRHRLPHDRLRQAATDDRQQLTTETEVATDRSPHGAARPEYSGSVDRDCKTWRNTWAKPCLLYHTAAHGTSTTRCNIEVLHRAVEKNKDYSTWLQTLLLRLL